MSDYPQDLPADLKPWDEEEMNYLAFTKDGALVHQDYKKTYNNVMLQHARPGDEEMYQQELKEQNRGIF